MDRCVCMSNQGGQIAGEAVKVGPAKVARYRPQAEFRFRPRLHPSPGEEMDDKRVYISSQGA